MLNRYVFCFLLKEPMEGDARTSSGKILYYRYFYTRISTLKYLNNSKQTFNYTASVYQAGERYILTLSDYVDHDY